VHECMILTGFLEITPFRTIVMLNHEELHNFSVIHRIVNYVTKTNSSCLVAHVDILGESKRLIKSCNQCSIKDFTLVVPKHRAMQLRSCYETCTTNRVSVPLSTVQ
jgi:hypothetical protein